MVEYKNKVINLRIRLRNTYDMKIYEKSTIKKDMDRVISGVYLLWNNNEIVYIGESYDIMNRLSHHKCSNKKWNSYSYRECETGLDRIIIEAILISQHKPKYNNKPNDLKNGIKSVKVLS